MANAVTNTTAKTQDASTAKGASTVVNPKSKLDGEAFMKLLLIQLKYQDPTEPMDSEKMLAQTSQLATLETQESTNKLMKELTTQLKEQSKSGANAYAISAIGKIANMGDVKLAVDGETSRLSYELYFEKPVEEGVINIKDKNNNVIASHKIEKGKKGVQAFTWDLKNSDGAKVSNGAYSVSATYKDADGNSHEVSPGYYPVEAVKFEKGVALLKLGSKYIPMTDIKEFSQG